MHFESSSRAGEIGVEVEELIRRTLSDTVRARSRARLREDVVLWTQALDSKGWLVPHWPEEYGGSRWPPADQYFLECELSKADCPAVDSIGLRLVAPVLYTFGSPEQRNYYLPRMRSGQDIWCQGFSESEAGSDLSRLATEAVQDGSSYVVTGRKLWITQAEMADRMLALVRVRTSGKPHHGLSLLIVDMKSPGVSCRPIVTLDGFPRINEVCLEKVRVPAESLVWH